MKAWVSTLAAVIVSACVQPKTTSGEDFSLESARNIIPKVSTKSDVVRYLGESKHTISNSYRAGDIWTYSYINMNFGGMDEGGAAISAAGILGTTMLYMVPIVGPLAGMAVTGATQTAAAGRAKTSYEYSRKTLTVMFNGDIVESCQVSVILKGSSRQFDCHKPPESIGR